MSFACIARSMEQRQLTAPAHYHPRLHHLIITLGGITAVDYSRRQFLVDYEFAPDRRGTVANVLARNGIEPVPERARRTKWSTFLKAHWKVLSASDFLTVEVWTGRGPVTHYLLLLIAPSTFSA